MLERDENGNIISKIPETAKVVPGMELLIIPVEGGLSEYSPKVYNSVNMFLRNAGYNAFVDNICDREWMEENKDWVVTEIPGICKLAAKDKDEPGILEVSEFLMKNITVSDNSVFKNQIENETTLTAYYMHGDKKIRIEFPYCTIEKIYNNHA